MLGWLYRIIIGYFHVCNHEWEIIKNREVEVYDDEIDDLVVEHYSKYLLQCKKCGDLKTVKLK